MRVRETPAYKDAMKRLLLKREKRREDKEKRRIAMAQAQEAEVVEGEILNLPEGDVEKEIEVAEGYEFVESYTRKKRDKEVDND